MDTAPSPDRWLVVEVPRPDESEAVEHLIEELSALSKRGVEERADRLVAYFAVDEPEAKGTLRSIEAAVSAVLGGTPPPLEHRWQAHKAWEELWRRGIAPRRVSDRIVVAPSWVGAEGVVGEVVVTLDPGIAFGTAEHATTRGCLRLLDLLLREGERVADIGCGSGILAVAAALLGAGRVLAVDIDPWACSTARENAETNSAEDRIEIRQESVGPDFFVGGPVFDGIAANIETEALLSLIPAFRTGLRPGGWLILSGIQTEESRQVVEAASSARLGLVAEDREPGSLWWTGGFRS